MKVFRILTLVVLCTYLVGCSSNNDDLQKSDTQEISILVSDTFNQSNTLDAIENENSNIEISSVSFNHVSEQIVENSEIKFEEYSILTKWRDSEYIVNNDFVGWISNDDFIDYPIMQSMKNSNYYLKRDFNGNSNKAGSIYIPWDVTLDDKIVLIYGHNMKDNSMFGTIDKYLDEDYFNKHKLFNLDTLYEEKVYEAVCLLESEVFDDSYTGFEYYNYRGNVTEEEFSTYIEGIRDLVKVGDVSSLTYGDNIIELITCWYSKDNARLVLVCKEIQD